MIVSLAMYLYIMCIFVVIRATSFKTSGLLCCLPSSEQQSLPLYLEDAFTYWERSVSGVFVYVHKVYTLLGLLSCDWARSVSGVFVYVHKVYTLLGLLSSDMFLYCWLSCQQLRCHNLLSNICDSVSDVQMHWRLNDGFGINRQRCHLTQNSLSLCVCT